MGAIRHRLARWAQHLEPAAPDLMRAFAAAYPRAVFIEVGANDGVWNDSLRPFILSLPWSGVMVEPVPWVFSRLCDNYRGTGGVAFENAAIADADGRVPFYYVRHAENLGEKDDPKWSDAIGSLSRAQVEETIAEVRKVAEGLTDVDPGIESRIERTDVPSLTFESLCRKHGIQELDLLWIDAEGYDYEIIKGIDFERHRPRLLIYESNHLSADERERSKAYLERHGYQTMHGWLDIWCHDPRADDDLSRCWQSVKQTQRRWRVRTLRRLQTRLRR